MTSFSIVVAMDRECGIGLNGKLPWKLSGDMRFFRELTRVIFDVMLARDQRLCAARAKTKYVAQPSL